ncbi:MAG: FAD-dependent oxidoreductase [Nitrospirota bacterium]
MTQSLTHTKDLRTGRSVWQGRSLPAIAQRPLTKDAKADVLIIGAGISGALIADAVSDAGLTVLIADRRGPLLGSTPASTALLQYDIDVPLCRLVKQIGTVRAERIWQRSSLALSALRERQRHLGIQADAINRDSLYLEGTELDGNGLLLEADARRRAGFEVTFLDQRTMKTRFGITRRAGLLSYDQLAVDPRRLAGGFLRAALSRRTQIVAPVEVTDLATTEGGVIATTKQGPSIHVRHLVFASGYEFPKCVPQKGHAINSTWAIATKSQPRALWPERCFVWEASNPYLYVRVGPDNRIICGGEDEDFSDEDARDALLDKKAAILERKLSRLFPRLDPQAEFKWCGSFGTSKTGTPSIGPLLRLKHCYAAIGYGGNGITFPMLAAQILRGMITGVGDSDTDLFSFTKAFDRPAVG